MYAGWFRFPGSTTSTKPMAPLRHLKTSLRVSCRRRYCSSPQLQSYISADVFSPLFEVTKDPSSHPELHVFLQRVIGFDTVDDESKTERRIHKKFPYPRLWDAKESPPYSYWWLGFICSPVNLRSSFECRIYYMYANMTSLNNWRSARGFSKLFIRRLQFSLSSSNLNLQTL
jgi:hypothetical protein